MKEDCELLVHYGYLKEAPSLALLRDDHAAQEGGYLPLWHEHVLYDSNATEFTTKVEIGPLPNEALHAEPLHVPHLHATMLRRHIFLAVERGESVPPEEVVQSSMPLVVIMKNLDSHSGDSNLWSSDEEQPQVNYSAKVPYFKTKLDIRPVVDHTAFQQAASQQGPFQRLKKFPDLGIYQPQLFISDFWLLEKDYLELNETLQNRTLNLTLSYSAVSLFAWSMQVQTAEQWMQQSEWGISDTQRDSFMLKRLYLDTNPYFLAFSAAFLGLHTIFSMLAFKNDIQFWRQNESMKGLSARAMIVSFVSQLITALYLLNSRETSRLILFEIVLDTGLAFWKLRKAVKIEVKREFPFIHFGGQKGYEEAGTDKYDEEALRYMYAIALPLFVGFTIRSSIYEKHRGWYTFFINTAAGAVYTFGFVMMTPQLYINYKLQSVEHMPWKALTYKAMSTFVDDVAAFLIDMPMMHRLACFRDDIIFFIYIYQRWKYRVDKTRVSTWELPDEGPAAIQRPQGEADAAQAATQPKDEEKSAADNQEN